MNLVIRMRKCCMTALFFTFAAIGAQETVHGADMQKLRPAGVAGSFYPADPAALTAMMDDMMTHASVPVIHGAILALVAPHAGYQYSGPVAAYSYAALKGRKYTRVVVIAPSHYEAFSFTSVYDGDGYATPLGTIPVDKAFAHQLAKMSPSIRLSDHGHRATAQGTEHALEVQLPWLQHVLGQFTLVPIIMGDQSYESSRALGVALARLLQAESVAHPSSAPDEAPAGTLIVASSDLSHYHTYNQAVALDHKTLSGLQSWDYFSMSRNFETRVWEACGGAPIVAAMIAAEREGANDARVLKYANSGDVAGDRSRVVGYSADIFVKAKASKAADEPFSLTAHEKEKLLNLARKSVEKAVREQKTYEPPVIADDALNQERGAFVTITESGGLRGCIGYTSAVKPLYLTVRDTATLAALRDPRFHRVSVEELPRLEYEVSVLSPLRRVDDVQHIRIGEHGLLMKNGDREGLLLPQVPVEQHWDRTQFLEETCRKAGLPSNCWKDEDTDIFSFTAVVFGEHHKTTVQ
jgi:AmmeMemoRadiSam system protein B/AmmeMemoRadiSam system protein A